MVRQPFPFCLSVQNLHFSHFAGTAPVLTSNSLQTFRSLLPASTKRASYSWVTLVPPSGDTTSQMQPCPRNLFLTSSGTRVRTNLFSQRHRRVGVHECSVEVDVGRKWVQYPFSCISYLDYSSFCYVCC